MLSRIPARIHSQLLVLTAVALGGVWMGCASNGDAPAEDQTAVAPATAASATTSAPDPSHPAFEAGFPDTSTADPTPDAGDVCLDNNDPGSTEATATKLPDTNDAQNTPITVKGIMNGPVDVDYYSLKMSDTIGHTIGAELQDGAADTEMCVFLRCLSGTLNFNQCDAGVEKNSDIGDKGCCTAGPGKANPNWSCGGFFQTNDSAQFYIRIKQTGTKACLPYSFSYAF